MNALKKRILALSLLVISLFLCACDARTIEQMYCLPKRSQEYQNLQAAIDRAMGNLSYCGPTAGENQQTVQRADLNGDGVEEYLLFAKGDSEYPLHILVFAQKGEEYALLSDIECLGTGFDRVEYVDIDANAGVELVVGRRLSDDVMGAVSVFSFASGEAQKLVSSNYSKFLTCDIDSDGKGELVILREGDDGAQKGVAIMYDHGADGIARSCEVDLSQSAANIKRIMVGALHGGAPAVYVASSSDGETLVTDVFAMKNGTFSNISFSNESGTSVATLRDHYVYAEDIDEDGILELPCLISVSARSASAPKQYLIRWFSLDMNGAEIDKCYTFHNFDAGWYVVLENAHAPYITVEQENGECVFYAWDQTWETAHRIFTIVAYTGESREQAVAENQMRILYRGESVIYAVQLEPTATSLGITEQTLANAFRLIHQEWKTGET